MQDAEALALKNNPQISVYRLLSLASNQVTREQRAAYYPTIYGSLTAVEPKEGSRIAAGNLNNPIVYERAAGGLTLSQLITDFGRTNNLVATAALRAKAADMNALATADQIKLAVDEAFYNALQTLAMLKVARADRQCAAAGIRPDHDPVPEQVALAARRQLRRRQPGAGQAAAAGRAKQLSGGAVHALAGAGLYLATAVRIWSIPRTELKPPPDAVSQLEDQAFSNRPEIASQRLRVPGRPAFSEGGARSAAAPVEAMGVVGRTPYSNTIAGVSPFTTWYGAVGVNVNVPIFNGFLYPARSREAGLRAQAANQQLRDLKDRIANDVRTSWLSAITAYNRIGVSQQFVDQTNLAFDLSQTRYNLGLSSIVELSQAQLQQTEAQIQFAAAKYQYRIAQSVLRFQIAAP